MAEVSRCEPEAPATTTARPRVSSTDSSMIDNHASVAGPRSHVARGSNPVINTSEETDTAASDLLEEKQAYLIHQRVHMKLWESWPMIGW